MTDRDNLIQPNYGEGTHLERLKYRIREYKNDEYVPEFQVKVDREFYDGIMSELDTVAPASADLVVRGHTIVVDLSLPEDTMRIETIRGEK